MKTLVVVLGAILLWHGLCFAEQKTIDPAVTTDREGYSLGYRFGEGLRKQGFDANLEALIRGIRDAVSGKVVLLTPEQMDESILNLRKRLVKVQEDARRRQREENLEKGKVFLAENGKKAGVVTLPSGLQFKVIVAGTGRSPKAGDRVTVNYRGTLIDGSEFDSSYKRNKPETIPVGGVMAGWAEALPLMKEGARWELFIPPDLGYGARGQVGRIPPNSTLVFEVELLAVN